MRKVGIMSMQRIANYGSFLQAYALKQLIEEFDCKVEFVDYHVGAPVMLIAKISLSERLKKVWELFNIRLRLHISYRSFVISSLFPKSICPF